MEVGYSWWYYPRGFHRELKFCLAEVEVDVSIGPDVICEVCWDGHGVVSDEFFLRDEALNEPILNSWPRHFRFSCGSSDYRIIHRLSCRHMYNS